jgi:hypothetical protein
MKPDPPVRPDKLCIVCQGERGRLPKAITQRAKTELKRELAKDPFCSNKCARDWHGTGLKTFPQKGAPADLDWSHA